MKTIAIIDDDIYIGNVLEETLINEGYAVSRAYSGTEALLLLSQSRPDLVLLDLMLPGLSGGRVAAKDTGKVQFTGDCAFCQKQFRQQSEFIDFGCRGLCDKAF